MSKVSFKVVGASGQGINSIGEIIAKGLKSAGYCVFAYREYPSLIKGGHASYQVDIDSKEVRSTERTVNIVVCFNYRGLERNLRDCKDGGIIIHDVDDWKWSDADKKHIEAHGIKVVYIPLEEILRKLKAKPILANVILTAFVWSALGQSMDSLKALVGARFAKKKDLLELNMRCVEEGFAYVCSDTGKVSVAMPAPDTRWVNHLLITGSQAQGLGAVHAGVRVYAGYPMTPSSPLLTYIAAKQKETGMVVKQAEDEITAVQMVSGAMFAGTRAFTGTSGGGFDLMTETVSMNGIMENPLVIALAQRPGPGTGLPTWTTQGDLLLAVNAGHGEFAKCVLVVSDAEDSFSLMAEAFNIAEEYQTVVIILSDKQSAESLYTQAPYDQERFQVRRGKVVTDPAELQKISASDRYRIDTPDGVSPRWYPGSQAATYCAQSDEHTPDGSTSEDGQNATQQIDKRMRKHMAMLNAFPDPVLYGAPKPEMLLVGWGSTKGPVLDVLEDPSLAKLSIGYLHYSYLWPLRTQRFEELARSAKTVALVEGNALGQLGKLITQECGYKFSHRILKYDGRPFFTDELLASVSSLPR